MSPEEIRIELFKRRKEMNMASIARGMDPPVSRQAVYHVIHRMFTSRRIMEAVAASLGRDVKYVFPEYYLKKRSDMERLCK